VPLLLQEYVSLSFSSDGKLLLAQGGRPDWNLLLWSWEKSKVASSTRATNTPGNPIVKVSSRGSGPGAKRLHRSWAPVNSPS
jgi:hypothetical protein